MTLGYSRNTVVLVLKGQSQGHRVNKCIFHTNDYYAHVNAHLTDNSNRHGFELYECFLVFTAFYSSVLRIILR